MRFIPTRVHGVMDYIVGALLIASPWLFGFAAGGAETWVPVVLGAMALVMSLMTDYELGLVPKIGVRMHLNMDLISGILLAASPWLFGFADYIWAPHLVFGLFEIMASLTTLTSPAQHVNRASAGHHPVVG